MSETRRETDRLEAVYDAEISPLMTQIIAICKRENLPMFATFKLDGDLACTSHIVPPLSEWPEADREYFEPWRKATLAAERGVLAQPDFAAFTITTRPADAV